MKRVLLTALICLVAVPAFAQRAPRAPGWGPADVKEVAFTPTVSLDPTPLATLFENLEMQTTVVSKPAFIEFNSPDHNATDAGSAVITSYSVTLFPVGSTTQAKPPVNIGKPASTTTLVSYGSFANVWSGLPAGQYNATVTATGPGGSATSPLSTTPFSVTVRAASAPAAPTFR